LGLKPSQSMKELTPGPGSYNLKRDLGRISYTMRVKPMASTKNPTPGPGAYMHRNSIDSIPGSKIGTSTRDGASFKAQAKASPGPAAYNIKTTLSKHAIVSSAPCFGFGTQSREGSRSRLKSPGPGSYQHREIVGKEGQRRSLIGSRPSSAGPMSPGPANYSPSRNFSAKTLPSYSIGTS